MKIGRLLRRQFLPGHQGPSGGLLHFSKIAMQPHIRDKLMQQHIPFGLVLFPARNAGCRNHMTFPVFVLGVKFMVALDMVDQGTVPISKVLPSLVAVRLPSECKINAKLGLVIARVCRIAGIQTGKQGVGLMQRHGLAVFQVGAFAPNHGNNRLRCRVKGRGLRLLRCICPRLRGDRFGGWLGLHLRGGVGYAWLLFLLGLPLLLKL